MDAKRIIRFLKDVSANNNREWFLAHKDEYLACKEDYEAGVAKAIAAITEFDPTVSHITPKDACFRFYRDTRFSQDKSPYKNHMGAYICAHGKKSLHAGYYLHIEPGRCIVSAGSYWLPTNILTSCRNEIMGNIDEWRKCVENGKFVKYFGYANEGEWNDEYMSPKGFGLTHLKTAPKDFPRDYEFLEYLKMKDYACWNMVGDDFFNGDKWLVRMADMFKVAKPMMDFMNSVIDDYE
ncbi:TIGR02453 family protein [Hoylesella oralis ATCC 33269]|uniref:TIGR02453 family protein n=1 Tax=Hoylesella oralis ATCC 33269 TaxID=873533 RepID=E7RPG8_9BACT|nr:DUF2461 domain-containing protein [Hoylesella oralis]EFZ37611.1 TIGR02453 family protein [Hoylesella oralis ATCC 33269]